MSLWEAEALDASRDHDDMLERAYLRELAEDRLIGVGDGARPTEAQIGQELADRFGVEV